MDILALYTGLKVKIKLNLIFLSDFDKLLRKTVLSNALFTMILGDFNARSLSWWKENKTTVAMIIFLSEC